MASCANPIRLSADASGIRFIRIRPIPGPSSCAAITIKDLRSVCRPRFPSSMPPRYVSSTSTRPLSRSRLGRTIALRNLCSHVQRRFIAAQPQHSLQPQGTGSVFLARQPVHGPEPVHQRFARVLENRPCRHRCLMTTFLALHEHRPYRPEVTAAATRAAKAFWPSKLEQILPARLLGIKPCFELAQIPRIFLHSPTYYMLGSPESSKYPPSPNPNANCPAIDPTAPFDKLCIRANFTTVCCMLLNVCA